MAQSRSFIIALMDRKLIGNLGTCRTDDKDNSEAYLKDLFSEIEAKELSARQTLSRPEQRI